ncbi:MAG: hypothetical protein G3H99_03945 [Ferrovum sp.]|nr:hypothetical protein [Ferrovum sp.]NDU87390.1 hypothetical protein [Ferrovum sp.]
MNNRVIAGTVAVMVGIALNMVGDWVLGVRIEVFRGIATFTLPWIVDVFLVPFMVGLLVAKIFGKHAKWLACVPPIVVRFSSYLYLYYLDHSHDFFFNFHLHYWGLCVILAVESANLGAILGEVLVGVYGRIDHPRIPAKAPCPAPHPEPMAPTVNTGS